jgi:hypothetical protein
MGREVGDILADREFIVLADDAFLRHPYWELTPSS